MDVLMAIVIFLAMGLLMGFCLFLLLQALEKISKQNKLIAEKLNRIQSENPIDLSDTKIWLPKSEK